MKKMLFLLTLISFLAEAQESSLQSNPDVSFSLHKENYIIPYSVINDYKDVPEANDKQESQFQISVKLKLIKFATSYIGVAYTQKSFWQVYDTDNSRPFRESNYNPEIFYRYGTDFIHADLGYEHESNGREEPKSRSWDRVYLKLQYTSPKFKISLKGWVVTDSENYGLEYEERESPIQDFYGTGEAEVGVLVNGTIFKVMGRYNPDFHNGYSESKILWKFSDTLFWGIIYTKGYGHSLRTYNIETETYGVGVFMNP